MKTQIKKGSPKHNLTQKKELSKVLTYQKFKSTSKSCQFLSPTMKCKYFERRFCGNQSFMKIVFEPFIKQCFMTVESKNMTKRIFLGEAFEIDVSTTHHITPFLERLSETEDFFMILSFHKSTFYQKTLIYEKSKVKKRVLETF